MEELQKLIKLGLKARAGNDRIKALDFFSKAVIVKPFSFQANLLIGEEYEYFNFYDRAKYFFQNCLEIDPFSSEAQVKLGGVIRKSGNATQNTETYLKLFSSIAANLEKTNWQDIPEILYAPYFSKSPIKKLPQRQYIFVSGIPRSGTSAFARLLNLNPTIGIGNERYEDKFGYCQSMFDKSIFFHNRNAWFNHQVKSSWNSLFNDFDKYLFVGDKRPNLMYCWVTTKTYFEPSQTKVIHVHRNIEDIAYSWNNRAKNTKDNWASTKDYRLAVKTANILNRYLVDELLEDKKWRKSTLVVRYQDIFSNSNNMLDIFEWITGDKFDVKFPTEYQVLQNQIITSRNLIIKERFLPKDNKDFIQKNYNYDLDDFIKKYASVF